MLSLGTTDFDRSNQRSTPLLPKQRGAQGGSISGGAFGVGEVGSAGSHTLQHTTGTNIWISVEAGFQWEWFVAGRMQQKPVELIETPGGSHLLERLRDRQIAMQGILDWFRYWLEDYMDPDPDKQEQYARWQKLRALESKENKKGCTN